MNFIRKLLGLVPKAFPVMPERCVCCDCTARRMLAGTQWTEQELAELQARSKTAMPPTFERFIGLRPLHRKFAEQRIQIISTQLGELDEELRAARAPGVRTTICQEQATLRHELQQLRKEYEL